jgi:hypothetical protein
MLEDKDEYILDWTLPVLGTRLQVHPLECLKMNRPAIGDGIFSEGVGVEENGFSSFLWGKLLCPGMRYLKRQKNN